MSDRLIELRVANRKLKEEIQNLETKISTLVGMVDVLSSGGEDKKYVLNEQIMELVTETQVQLNIVSPRVDRFYTNTLLKKAKKGIPILLIMNDRRNLPKEYLEFYDELKNQHGISVINNPNIRYLLLFNEKQAIISGGSLDKEELEQSVLIVIKIKAKEKLRRIAEIFSLMLPSFMRG